MSTNADLMGLGMAPALAARLGNSVQTIIAAGTNQAGATVIPSGEQFHIFNITTAGGATGVVMNSDMSIGAQITLTNPGSTSAVIYPNGAGTFNTAASTSLTLAQFKTVEITKLTATTFCSILTA